MQFLLAGGFVYAVIKVLAAFGIGILTYTAVQSSFDALITQLQTNYGGLPTDMLQIFGIYGVHDALGIVLGAMVVRATIVFVSKIGILPS